MVNETTLFDQSERTREDPQDIGSSFAYCNLMAWPTVQATRSTLDDWFRRYPDNGKSDLRSRFRQKDNLDHYGAFFELFLHELAVSAGFNIDLHPNVAESNTKPDFLLTKSDIPAFYLEAQIVGMPDETYKQDARADQVYKVLNGLRSPDFFLSVETSGAPENSPTCKSLKRKLESWLETLNPDEIESDCRAGRDSASYSWKDGSWELTFRAIAKPPEIRGQSGIRNITVYCREFERRTVAEQIRRGIHHKATKYGELGKPYIIAVNCLDVLSKDSDVFDAMFGDPGIVEQRNAGGEVKFIPRRHRNGELNRTKLTRVSGVLYFRSLFPESLRPEGTALIHNPWAKYPLSMEAWPIRQYRIDGVSGDVLEMDGHDPSEIIGIRAAHGRP